MTVVALRYNRPVLGGSYIRQRGHDPDAARDLTQGLLVAVLERGGDRVEAILGWSRQVEARTSGR